MSVDDPLANERVHRMHHFGLVPAVADASCDPIEQTDRPVGLAQQKRPGIRRHRATIPSL